MCQTREVCMHQLLSYFQHKLFFRKHVKPQSRKGCKQVIKCFPILKSNLRVGMNIWLTDVQIHLGCQALSFCKCCFNNVLLHYCLLGCFFFVGEEKRKLFKVLFRSWLSGRLKSCRCSQETTGLKTVLILIYIYSCTISSPFPPSLQRYDVIAGNVRITWARLTFMTCSVTVLCWLEKCFLFPSEYFNNICISHCICIMLKYFFSLSTGPFIQTITGRITQILKAKRTIFQISGFKWVKSQFSRSAPWGSFGAFNPSWGKKALRRFYKYFNYFPHGWVQVCREFWLSHHCWFCFHLKFLCNSVNSSFCAEYLMGKTDMLSIQQAKCLCYGTLHLEIAQRVLCVLKYSTKQSSKHNRLNSNFIILLLNQRTEFHKVGFVYGIPRSWLQMKIRWAKMAIFYWSPL